MVLQRDFLRTLMSPYYHKMRGKTLPTGVPFASEYSMQSCSDMCYNKEFYKRCNCTSKWGWNLTNSECIEKLQSRQCLSTAIIDQSDDLESKTENCRSKCHAKCNAKSLQTAYSRQKLSLSVEKLMKDLNWLKEESEKNVLAGQLLDKISQSDDPQQTAQLIAQNVAYLTFYMDSHQPDTHINVIPIMTFPSFAGNMGGIIGVFIGISAISLLEYVEFAVFRVITREKVASFTCFFRD